MMTISSVAYFFDAKHPCLPEYSYGPPCTGTVIAAHMKIADAPSSSILRGDLVAHTMAYELSSIVNEQTKTGLSAYAQYSASHNRHKLIVSELVDSLCVDFHTINQDSFILDVASKIIWTIVLTHVRSTDFQLLHDDISKLPAFLGCAVVDWSNSIQKRSIALLDGAFISNGILHCRFDPDGEYRTAKRVAFGYGIDTDPVALSPEEFWEKCPRIEDVSISQRGKLSELRLNAGKSSYAQRVALAIQKAIHNKEITTPINFTVPKGVHLEYKFDDRKIHEYILNLEHVKGRSKAKFFQESLGIEKKDWRYLKDQILHGMENAEIYRFKNTEHGFENGAYVPITGLNGRTAIIIVGWMFRNDGSAHFITARPIDENEEFEAPANPSWIIPSTLKGNEYWNELHRVANNAGLSAATNVVPSPMLLEGYAPVFEGVCGFAWVRLPDARSKFCRWLSRNKIGHRHYHRGWEISVNLEPNPPFYDTQSMEPKYRYAQVYADVLIRNGIDAIAEQMLD
jgi:hypothetical protein